MRNRTGPQIALAALLWISSLQTTVSQESIDSYPDLEPSDFGPTPQPRIQAWNDIEGQRIAPFRIFDNLYYVGIQWVSSYLLVTDDGLILIDALYGNQVQNLVDGIRQLGFDPEDIKYLLVTHGHFDHVGGAAYFQREFGAKVGMAAWDWKRSEADAGLKDFSFEPPKLDLVFNDGDVLELGGQVIRFYVTPGHTEGVLSMEFTVDDGENRHRAFVLGGGALNFKGVWRTKTYISSIRRIRTLAVQSPNIEVNVSNHPSWGRIIQRHEEMVGSAQADAHPFVDPAGFLVFLDDLIIAAEKKLLEEMAASQH